MKIRFNFLWLTFILLILSSCQNEGDSVLVEGNIAPPDPTIERVVVEGYVNKLYISLLGREPSTSEFNNAIDLLGEKLNQQDRLLLVSQIQENPNYYKNQLDIFRQDYLNGIDTAQIREEFIEPYEYALENEENSIIYEEIENELNSLYLLYDVDIDLFLNNIDVMEVHRRMVDNPIYDDINMGIENYIVSMSQNFLHRYPTTSELENATLMVDGEQSYCFGGNGDSKSDFNNLFFNHDGYFEGQVVTNYNKLLYRNPNSSEASESAYLYKQNRNFKELQKSILISNEFIGIE
ncbi:hypothetical protein N9H19_02490 [Flavobacteriales bacterium]|nr:hypothetical protein [Flavobacteriales bacterium]